jgi:hypothetical protein
MCFDVENECIREKNQKFQTKDSFYQEHKKNLFFWEFLLDINF